MAASISWRFPLAAVVVMAVVLLAGCAGASSGGAAGTPAAETAPGSVGASDGEPDGEAPTDGSPNGALIVRTGELLLEVADVEVALPSARSVVAGLGGYVAG